MIPTVSCREGACTTQPEREPPEFRGHAARSAADNRPHTNHNAPAHTADSTLCHARTCDIAIYVVPIGYTRVNSIGYGPWTTLIRILWDVPKLYFT
eukprot:6718093-Prymnesium_polylepis.2